MDKKEETTKNNLFKNSMVSAAMRAMTPEQIEEYKRVGEYMYSTSDFEEKNPQPRSLEEETTKGVFYTREALKAGLHPQDLSPKEVQLMYDIYGIQWYEEFGYEKDEVPEPEVKINLFNGVDTSKSLLTKKQIKKLEKRLRKKDLKKKNPKANFKKIH